MKQILPWLLVLLGIGSMVVAVLLLKKYKEEKFMKQQMQKKSEQKPNDRCCNYAHCSGLSTHLLANPILPVTMF